MTSFKKFALTVLIIALGMLAALFVLTSSPPRVRADEARHRVVASNPDPRVTWRQYPVGGLLLCLPNKDIADTLGVPQCQEIPPGAVLLIPVVADPVKSPDRRKS